MGRGRPAGIKPEGYLAKNAYYADKFLQPKISGINIVRGCSKKYVNLGYPNTVRNTGIFEVRQFSMQTVVVEINDEKALHLLEELEGLNILRIVKENVTKPPVKLSDKYKGVFTKEDAKSFMEHTQNSRKEWDDT